MTLGFPPEPRLGEETRPPKLLAFDEDNSDCLSFQDCELIFGLPPATGLGEKVRPPKPTGDEGTLGFDEWDGVPDGLSK